MLDPDVLASLATFWSDNAAAVSFYFSEPRPDNLAHRGGMVTAKEQARQLLRKPTTVGHNLPATLVDRLIERASAFRAPHPAAGIAIFASAQPEFWREIELPYAPRPSAEANHSFRLAPLVPCLADTERYFLLLLDRSVTRLLLMQGATLSEKTKEFGEERFPVRETGGSGKVSDERSLDDDAFHHLRRVGERVLKCLEQGQADALYIGCRKDLWAEIEAAFPAGALHRTHGHFHCDPGLATAAELRELVQPRIDERRQLRDREAVDRALAGAASDGLGLLGPAELAAALERGEAQTIFLAPHDPAPAAVCTSCGHIETGPAAAAVPQCPLCGQPARAYSDLAEVLLRRAGKHTFNLIELPPGILPPQAAGFAALLRFRAARAAIA